MSASGEYLTQTREKAIRAWATYDNTVKMGGTPEQRKWACRQALQAEAKLATLERALKINQPARSA